jgi:hypothetical protein
MESSWVPEMQELLGLGTHRLPVIWDADFLYGTKTTSGVDTFVLREINASSTFAFPERGDVLGRRVDALGRCACREVVSC